eukprot:SAG31_NODE_12350_length_948_cov_0.905771_1_plen_44_part_10
MPPLLDLLRWHGSSRAPSQRNDGVFWMEWHDFLQRFTRIDVLKA